MKKNILLTAILLLLTPVIAFAQDTEKKYFSINKNLSIFNSILKELNANYVDTIDYDKAIKSGIDNMLRTLDPYTIYIPEKENDQLKMMTSGEYAGIGALIMQKDNQIIISEPYKGKPAEANGLRAGDIIKEVDGKSTKGKTTSEVSDMLRGKNGTKIRIKIKRPYQKRTKTFTFLRKNIQFDPVTYTCEISDGIGYIMLSDFTDKAAIQVKSEVEKLIIKNNIHSLIIDVRNNGGGLVNEAVKILGFFLPKGTEVLMTKGRNEETTHTYRTPNEPIFENLKLAILVNRSSASASEILAGAVQDLDRGVIVGERTFGKGLVQNVHPVGYGGYLKTTIAKYYIPSGRCVQALDYTHRNEDGSVGSIPDSLLNTFKTKKGRIVKDGGGILPDTITQKDKDINVSYYIYSKNLFFDYATRFAHEHKSIASPTEFRISDEEFQKFVEFIVEEKKFKNKTETEKQFNRLLEIARLEGLDKKAKTEIELLQQKLLPDVRQSIAENKEDVREMLTIEIIQRYYHDRGQTEYMLQDDKDIKAAIAKLRE